MTRFSGNALDPSFAEFYFNGRPLVWDPTPGTPGVSDGFFTLTFTRRNGAPGA